MIKDVENIDKEVSWLTFKGYSIRLEVSKKFTNSNLVITVNPSSEEEAEEMAKDGQGYSELHDSYSSADWIETTVESEEVDE